MDFIEERKGFKAELKSAALGKRTIRRQRNKERKAGREEQDKRGVCSFFCVL